MKSKISFLAYPTILWFAVFLFLPILIVFATSFATRGTYGGVEWIFTTSNYSHLFRSIYFEIFSKSLLMAFTTAFICTSLGFFMAWAMATSSKETKKFWMMCLMLPFLTNLVIRIYAIKLFVGMDGPVQYWLRWMGFEFDPFSFTSNSYLVTYGLITCYLPFAVFPIYSAFEKFDFNLIEAAQDLGSNHCQTIYRIIIPNLRVAILNAFSLVFVPCLGEYVIPDLLGGAKQMLVGNLITEQFLKSRHWPIGSAVSVILFFILALFFLIMSRLKRRKL